jgi:hypothetical protein
VRGRASLDEELPEEEGEEVEEAVPWLELEPSPLELGVPACWLLEDGAEGEGVEGEGVEGDFAGGGVANGSLYCSSPALCANAVAGNSRSRSPPRSATTRKRMRTRIVIRSPDASSARRAAVG